MHTVRWALVSMIGRPMYVRVCRFMCALPWRATQLCVCVRYYIVNFLVLAVRSVAGLRPQINYISYLN